MRLSIYFLKIKYELCNIFENNVRYIIRKSKRIICKEPNLNFIKGLQFLKVYFILFMINEKKKM